MRRRPMVSSDRQLFLAALAQARIFASRCEEGERHDSSLRRRCEDLLVAIDRLAAELRVGLTEGTARVERGSVAGTALQKI